MKSNKTQFVSWLKWLIDNPELPESLEVWNYVLTDETQRSHRDIAMAEFWDMVLTDLGVPEEDWDELMDAFEASGTKPD